MGEFANRRVLALAGLVLLSVAAISMSAATLTSTEGVADATDGTPDFVPAQQNGSVGGDDPNASQLDMNGDATSGGQPLQLSGCNELLASTPGSLAFFTGLVAVLYLLKRRFSLGLFVFGGYAIVPVALATYFLRTDCVTAGGGAGGGGGGLGSGLQQPTPAPDVPPEFMLGFFALLFVGVAAAVYVSSGSREVEPDAAEETVADADVEDIAAAAAEAAERLEERNADVDNEVYRAWWEMTQLLDVASPGTTTPGEFADAAVELGIDAAFVDPLTTLFEEVRYGHADPESREDRALEVFRAIEDEYGGAGTAAAAGGTTDDSNDDDTTEDQR